ncbi:MAG: hypothetical protein IJO16_00750 [Clostridia bacterium]|nr:hypothetical protein [Clostridia bacterium]
MKKKNNVIITMFLIYIIAVIYFAVKTPHDSELVDVVSFAERMKNADYLEFFFIFVLLTALFYGIRYFLMSKWCITLICPRCGTILDIRKIKITFPDGFLCEQTCQNCGKTFTPDDKG